mmetsp:Transcript_20312/g.44855  ORF Transcript_20312/g.44855 Transcript_20312/m.44855 type:complete len:260 (-) Transcript_20312:702-1481(-)
MRTLAKTFIAALRNFRRPLAATELPLSAVLRLSVVFLFRFTFFGAAGGFEACRANFGTSALSLSATTLEGRIKETTPAAWTNLPPVAPSFFFPLRFNMSLSLAATSCFSIFSAKTCGVGAASQRSMGTFCSLPPGNFTVTSLPATPRTMANCQGNGASSSGLMVTFVLFMLVMLSFAVSLGFGCTNTTVPSSNFIGPKCRSIGTPNSISTLIASKPLMLAARCTGVMCQLSPMANSSGGRGMILAARRTVSASSLKTAW